MRTLFIPAKLKIKIDKEKIKELSEKLPKNIAIAYSIQCKNLAHEIKQILSKSHKITEFIQVLGCSKPSFPKPTQAVLLISSGKFHEISLSTKKDLPIYILYNNNLIEPKKDIEELKFSKARQKVAYLKFLNSDKIGILVSVKPGQENLKKALELKKKLNALGKKSYILIGNELNSPEFENFFLESWINTACPRLDMDSVNNKVINLETLSKLLKF